MAKTLPERWNISSRLVNTPHMLPHCATSRMVRTLTLSRSGRIFRRDEKWIWDILFDHWDFAALQKQQQQERLKLHQLSSSTKRLFGLSIKTSKSLFYKEKETVFLPEHPCHISLTHNAGTGCVRRRQPDLCCAPFHCILILEQSVWRTWSKLLYQLNKKQKKPHVLWHVIENHDMAWK